MSILRLLFCSLLMILSLQQNVFAEEAGGDDDSSTSLSLGEILNLKLTVSSKVPLTSRESPGIVSVITAQEIKAMGARDLTDVLATIPGIQFASDVTGIVGIGVRGAWAHEGKALILWDGHEMNEPMFSVVPFGHHFSVDQISRVEVIRGPGSAIYGGNAELAVIKITSKSADEIKGTEVTVRAAQMNGGLAQTDISLQAGKRWGDSTLKVSAFTGKSQTSNRDYTDFSGNTFNMAGANDVNPNQLSLQYNRKDLEVAFMYDHYLAHHQDGLDTALPRPIRYAFDSLLFRVKDDFKVTEKLKLTPFMSYAKTAPWASSAEDVRDVGNQDPAGDSSYPWSTFWYERETVRLRAGVSSEYDITKDIILVSGIEDYKDTANVYNDVFASNGQHEVNYENLSAYSQALWKASFGNLTAGARYDHHSAYGDSFVPRVGFTKVMDKLHMKALFSNAFRAPSISNIDINTSIKPETTQTLEFEAGYQFNQEMFATFNVFDNRIKDTIIYQAVGGEDNYTNGSTTGSQGFEVEYKFLKSNFNFQTAFSFYKFQNEIPDYEVPGDKDAALAFATQKLTVKSGYNFSKSFSVNGTAQYLGSRYGYDVPASKDGTGVLRKYDPSYLVDIYGKYSNLYVKNLSVGFGLYNILDEDFRYIQPYNGYHAALPALPRQAAIDITYQSTF